MIWYSFNNGLVGEDSGEVAGKVNLQIPQQTKSRLIRRRIPNNRREWPTLGTKGDRSVAYKQIEQDARGDCGGQRAQTDKTSRDSETEVDFAMVGTDGSGDVAGLLWRPL